MSERLRQLAQLWGIEAAGVAEDVLVAVLGACGVEAGTPAAVEAGITAWNSARATQWLPAAHVVDAEARVCTVPLRLPRTASRWRWELVDEEGRRHEGEIAADPEAFGTGQAVDWRLPWQPSPGLQRLALLADDGPQALCALVAAPRRAYRAPALEGGHRAFGAAVSWPQLVSQRQWGIGDATDLSRWLEQWGQHGAAVLGVGEWSAALPDGRVSHRGFFHPLLIDLTAVPEWAECDAVRERTAAPEFRQRLAELRAAAQLDLPALWALKWPLLEALHAHFVQRHLAAGTARARAYQAFRAEGGSALQRAALFEAVLAEQRRAHGDSRGWTDWPPALHDADGEDVQAFAATHAEAVDCHAWAHWLAREQLVAVGHRSWTLGLGVGLLADLSWAPAREGAEAWAARHLVAPSVAAAVSPQAAEAGDARAAWRPDRLRGEGLRLWQAVLRAPMQPAGALRLDGIGALARQWWFDPDDPSRGAWVRMPFEELLAVARLESARARCLLVAADVTGLGATQRERLRADGLLIECDALSERAEDGEVLVPATLPASALLALTPARGPAFNDWWDGQDLPPPATTAPGGRGAAPEPHGGGRAEEDGARAQAVVGRAGDRARLLLALERAALLPSSATVNPVSVPVVTPEFVRSLQRWLARSPAAVLLVRMHDLAPAGAQAGPGSTRLAVPLEQWRFDDDLLALQRALGHERLPAASRRAPAANLATRVPRATYRVQLHRDFGFAAATPLVPYLSELGISHLYCSPILRARAGSSHGYDVVDHGQLNPEIGSTAEVQRLVDTLHRHGMGLLLDVVPNHMGVLGGDNAWWLDVLENGPASAFAEHFDIDWHAADPALTGRVLVPILGDQYGVVLERGELQLAFDADGGRFQLRYHEHVLPIDPVDYGHLMRRALAALPGAAVDASALEAAASLADAFERLPARATSDEAERIRRRRDRRVLQARLAQLARLQPALTAALNDLIAVVNGTPGDRASFDALDVLIDRQAYRLAHWRIAGDEINYRRFFDINDLAALRMERAEVFESTHRLVLQWLADGWVDGLRIDHSDGLADPAGYFRRLQQRYAEVAGAPPEVVDAAPRTRPLYVVTEKITAAHEEMPRDWSVHGTTGYRFANVVNGLLIDAGAKGRLDRAWRAFVGDEARDFEALAWQCRELVMEGALSGELTVLATALLRLAREDRRTRDFTLNTLRRALTEVIAAFPVYRTYVQDRPSAQDRRHIAWAVGRARQRSRVADPGVFDFVHRVLLGRPLPRAPAGQAQRVLSFVRRFQQFTAPVAAKGLEDTALYRHHRLISVNDVGGEPDPFGFSVAAFHAASRDRALHWPHTMLATSTHDAKRSEDVRTRIDVISEMPAAWRLTVRRWSRMNRRHRRTVGGELAPSRSDEYLLYQTLAGCMPAQRLDDDGLAALASRVEQAMLKSAREAKLRTAWLSPDAAYEAALSAFVRVLLERRDSNLFLPDLEAQAPVFAWYGALNGLTMAAIKAMSPGVPDIYQGHEAIELSLVDPDNRRPVDFAHRARLLGQARELAGQTERGAVLAQWLAQAVDGRAKFWTLWCALALRRENRVLLAEGDYIALDVQGERAAHLVAFARRDASSALILVAARLYASLGLAVGQPPVGALWGDTRVCLPPNLGAPGQSWTDAISGRSHAAGNGMLSVAPLLAEWPVCLLQLR